MIFARPRRRIAAISVLARVAGVGLLAALHVALPADAVAKPFMEYLKPTPVTCSPLSSATWGVAGVLPRDLCNGIESAKGAGVPPDYYYWDGEIIRAQDGKYHLFMSTWAGSAGFNPGWTGSDAYHAISQTSPLGPYERQGYVYTNNGSHKGHNVSALELPDGTYAVVVSETVPFTIYKSSSLDGPWTGCQASIDANGINYGSDANFASNVSLVARHDGKFEIVQRHGLIGVADTLCGPYKLQKPTWAYPTANRPSIDSIYPKRTSIPGVSNPTFQWEEDPHIWRSGGIYHVLYSGSGDRVGYHLYSADGIHDWTDNGLAFTPRQYQDIFCYADGTCSQWYKMERPGVLLEGGHPTHITWAVADVDKDNQIPAGSNHGSKVIVVPIDGVAFDADFGTGAAGASGSGGMGGASGAAGGPSTGGNAGIGGAGAGGNASGSGGLAGSATAGEGGTSGASASGGASGGMDAGGAGTTSTGGLSAGGASGGGTPSSGSGGQSGAVSAGSGGHGGTVSAGGSMTALAGHSSGGLATGGNASGGAGAESKPSGAAAQDSSGCGCAVPSTSKDKPVVRALLLGAMGILAFRRRRRRSPGSSDAR